MTYKKHPTSIIDKGAEIGDDTNIWHWSHICSEAKIGNSVTIGQNVFIANKVVIGDRCKIQNNVSIFDNVTLEEEVFCAPSVVFTNVYNPRSSIVRKEEYKNTTIKKGATYQAHAILYSMNGKRLIDTCTQNIINLFKNNDQNERNLVIKRFKITPIIHGYIGTA